VDVHILIEGTLSASIQFLNGGAKTELAKIEQWMKKPASDEYTFLTRTGRMGRATANLEGDA